MKQKIPLECPICGWVPVSGLVQLKPGDTCPWCGRGVLVPAKDRKVNKIDRKPKNTNRYVKDKN